MRRLAKHVWLQLAIYGVFAFSAHFLCAVEFTAAGTPASSSPASSTPAVPAAGNSSRANPDVAKIFAGGVPQTIADLKRMEEAQRKLAERITPCTVNVRLGQAQGSGVVVSTDGYILTAAHVAHRPNVDIVITFPDGRMVRGRTLGLYRTLDAGLAKITDPGPWPFVEMEKSDTVKEGQWCVAMGHPGGLETGRKPVMRVGRVLSISDSVIVSDCTLVGGDSGGPLFNAEGRVIGIHSRIGSPLTANMHVPVKAFHDTWERLTKAEAWGHLPGQIPYIGVRGDGDAKNAKITQVFSDTPADKAGLKVGDVVTKFDGQQVGDFASLSNMVANKQPGERVKVELKRGEVTVEIELVIGKRGG